LDAAYELAISTLLLHYTANCAEGKDPYMI
jgi:hypothetical protein